MRYSKWPFIPANDYYEINSLCSFAGINGLFDLHIITHCDLEVYCGYFRRLVFGNSLTFSHIPHCFHAKPPNFPCLFDPVYGLPIISGFVIGEFIITMCVS